MSLPPLLLDTLNLSARKLHHVDVVSTAKSSRCLSKPDLLSVKGGFSAEDSARIGVIGVRSAYLLERRV